MRKLGKLERTLFTLDWLQDPELGRRCHFRGEQRNALRRAVFLSRFGEICDRSDENRRYRARGLNSLVAAIFVWNTAYLQRALEHYGDGESGCPAG